MKLILSGATGFIGAEVLHQCLLNPSITSLVTLTRRPLPLDPEKKNPKLESVVMSNFTSYDDAVMQKLAGADSCIWALGAKGGSVADLQRSEIEYTMAAATTFARELAPMLPQGKKFRFVYLSGMIAERDQGKRLWYAQDGRRIKGEVENKLIELGEQDSDVLETFIVKPGMVLSKQSSYVLSNPLVGAVMGNVKIEELVAVMVDTVISGNDREIMEYNDLQVQGKLSLHGKGSCYAISGH